MKKWIAILLTLCLGMLAACAAEPEQEQTEPSTTQETTVETTEATTPPSTYPPYYYRPPAISDPNTGCEIPDSWD